jgi:predicted transcriptional regulator
LSERKRGFIDIVGDILQSINEKPLKKSHISHNCNLDPRSTTKYLKIIQNLKLVEKSEDLQHYTLTEKGIKFLKQYTNLTEFLSNHVEKDKK